MKYILILWVTSLFSLPVFCQTSDQREVIKSQISKEDSLKSAIGIENYNIAKKKRIDDYLIANPNKKATYTKFGRVHYLSDISSDGKPLYIVTKKKRKKTKM